MGKESLGKAHRCVDTEAMGIIAYVCPRSLSSSISSPILLDLYRIPLNVDRGSASSMSMTSERSVPLPRARTPASSSWSSPPTHTPVIQIVRLQLPSDDVRPLRICIFHYVLVCRRNFRPQSQFSFHEQRLPGAINLEVPYSLRRYQNPFNCENL